MINVLYGIGVDIGGTKIASAVVDQDGNILSRSEVKSNTQNRELMFNQVVHCIDRVLEEAAIPVSEIAGLGVGVPGKIDRENGIAIYQNNLPWDNFPVVKRLRERYHTENIVIDNDVYMAAFAEWNAVSLSEGTFVYFTLSTGIACSIMNDGKFLRGGGFAGEIGLLPVISPYSKTGVENLEKSASGPFIEQLAKKRFNNPHMTAEDFFTEYKNGNHEAKELLNIVVKSLTHGVYAIICLLDPKKIVFGGGVINHQPYLLDLIKTELRSFMIPSQHHSLDSLELSRWKGDSGIVGAGLQAIQRARHLGR